MTREEVAAMVSAVGIPYAYYQFDDKTAADPPFICFFYGNSEDLVADNQNYQTIERLYIELYTDEKDFNLEATVEGILKNWGLPFYKSEEHIDSEKLYEVVYETTVIITEESNNG